MIYTFRETMLSNRNEQMLYYYYTATYRYTTISLLHIIYTHLNFPSFARCVFRWLLTIFFYSFVPLCCLSFSARPLISAVSPLLLVQSTSFRILLCTCRESPYRSNLDKNNCIQKTYEATAQHYLQLVSALCRHFVFGLSKNSLGFCLYSLLFVHWCYSTIFVSFETYKGIYWQKLRLVRWPPNSYAKMIGEKHYSNVNLNQKKNNRSLLFHSFVCIFTDPSKEIDYKNSLNALDDSIQQENKI